MARIVAEKALADVTQWVDVPDGVPELAGDQGAMLPELVRFRSAARP